MRGAAPLTQSRGRGRMAVNLDTQPARLEERPLTGARFPRNPDPPVALTLKQFELRVGRWIRAALSREGITDFTIEQQGVVTGDGGD